MTSARIDALLHRIRHANMRKIQSNQCSSLPSIVAFSGGVDSSLVASLVHRVFPLESAAVLGISPAVSIDQVERARTIANEIGIQLVECNTTEGEDNNYVENRGRSCYHCKTNLYTTMHHISLFTKTAMMSSEAIGSFSKIKATIYNGTNADDRVDPTRLGLVAADEFDVVSPLDNLSKAQVREIARFIGLSNWNVAASPCLRSRLAYGVEATKDHLKRVEKAEAYIRQLLALPESVNLRVRFLTKNRAAVEVDQTILAQARSFFENIQNTLIRIGFASVILRPFKTGSVSGFASISAEK
ncbi:hypothetical protein ABG067_006017 [Albugo candida]